MLYREINFGNLIVLEREGTLAISLHEEDWSGLKAVHRKEHLLGAGGRGECRKAWSIL
jgi:hypothetical protein